MKKVKSKDDIRDKDNVMEIRRLKNAENDYHFIDKKYIFLWWIYLEAKRNISNKTATHFIKFWAYSKFLILFLNYFTRRVLAENCKKYKENMYEIKMDCATVYCMF